MSNSKQRLLDNLHKMLRQDEYINQLCNASGIEIDEIEVLLQDIYNQFWFDTMTWYADILAREMHITFEPTLSQADKNSLIEARWKNNGKSDIDLLQSVANSWKNGDTQISFINGKIQVQFVGEYGVPTDLGGLKSELNKAKPAHLIIEYIFRYLIVSDVTVMTVAEMQTHKINEFAF